MGQNVSAGTLSLFADGQALRAMGDFTYSTAETEVEVRNGVDRHKAEIHTPVTPFIAGTLSDSGDLDTRTLHAARFDTVQLKLLNGKSVKMNKAIQITRIEVDAINGTFPVKFEGTIAPDEDIARLN